MKTHRLTLLATVLVSSASLADSPPPRECVLDRKVHLEEAIVPVPKVAPLCDELKLARQRINIGDCELYCETEGEGPALVLINGGPGGTHHDFHPHFAPAARFATIIYYDQRGCGQSDYKKGAGYTVDQAVDDIDKLRRALKHERIAVLGWSYGGVLAQSYAVKYPQHTLGVILVATSDIGHRLDLAPGRQVDLLSAEERKKINQIYNDKSLSMAEAVFNAHLNGDWKRQNFYRPTRDDLARTALYGWKHDSDFRDRVCDDLDHVYLGGFFKDCPIPVMIMEGKQDLTWDADKTQKFAACFPGAKLVQFDRSAHGPFADEPVKFFAALGEFLKALPREHRNVEAWQRSIARLRETPQCVIATAGWGPESSQRIAAQYAPAWLKELRDGHTLFRLGTALYDAKRYDDALAVFRAMEQTAALPGVATVWQGHMLDLLGQRDGAIAAYKKAVGTGLDVRHDNYGLILSPDYVKERLRTPFTRVENGRRR